MKILGGGASISGASNGHATFFLPPYSAFEANL
jgi:hypothetical protein